MNRDHLFCRRQFLGATGLAGLGLGLLPDLASGARPVTSPSGRINSCVLIFYYGGPSHLDTLDPKPDAPAEVRGEYRTIATSVPGL
ncbi:MAG TPA: twin-arginine translocation signal domain-containing protein, partial [Gemmataceae bacterium]|nr:twin-arginine translocation signal domain-containing protein [Gemmataceae bacterium]